MNTSATTPRYVVKCDECKCEMRRTDSVPESAAGGICQDCRTNPSVVGPTRARRERRAANLREWAARREAKAAVVFEADKPFTTDHAFNTQPGHIPFRAKLIERHDRQFESLTKAEAMASRADGIAAQLATSIYDDDPDAIEQLRAKIERLEAKRAAIKARPHQGWELSNLGATIRNARKRIDELKRKASIVEAGGRGPGRAMLSKYAGTCAICGESFERGTAIVYYRLTREAVHGHHDYNA